MIIQFENININYGEKKAVSNFTYEFCTGVYGLIGENGAGKTSIMNVMSGIYPFKNGKIMVDGNQVSSVSKSYPGLIGYLPQVNPMYPNFKVQEYMEYVAYLNCVDIKKTNEIDRLLELVHLEEKKKEKCKNLSGGMKRRLGIAQALIGNPFFLIFDEPTAGVDVMERVKFRNIISGLGNDHIVLFSTHTISDIGRMAKELIIMNNGEIVCSGGSDYLIDQLHGKVWEAEVNQSEYEKIVSVCTERRITSLNVNQYIYKVRYVYHDKVVESAKSAEPSIEEVYAEVMN